MSGRPHPDDPTAEVCALTGDPAHARIEGRVARGWYGSAVVDGNDCLVARPGSLPEGPVSDAVLRRALASGDVYDPSGLLDGRVSVSDVPDHVVEALAAHGASGAAASLDRGAGEGLGLHVPPVHRVEEDDPLTIAPAAALFGRPLCRGVDLVALGSLAAVVLRARGRAVDPEAVGRDVLARVRSAEGVARDILDALGPAEG